MRAEGRRKRAGWLYPNYTDESEGERDVTQGQIDVFLPEERMNPGLKNYFPHCSVRA